MRARFFDHAGSPKRSRWRSWTYCLPLHRQRRHPESVFYRGSMAGLHVPLPTLRRRPCKRQRTARGRCGSLPLHRVGLAPTTPCRSPGALRILSRGGISDTNRGGIFRRAGIRLSSQQPSVFRRFSTLLDPPGGRGEKTYRVRRSRFAALVLSLALLVGAALVTCICAGPAPDGAAEGRL